ncbi:hypothetical protein OQA88_10790 [Cercophora sp. LCS_1]
MDHPKIAILGAGPSGLLLARLLSLSSIPYTIYERDTSPSSSRAGGSLDIHDSTGQLALRKAGLFDEFQKHARYDDTVFSVSDKGGERLLEIGQGRDAPEIDRAELRRLLVESVPGDTIKWGYALREVRIGGDGRPELRFGNGEVSGGWGLVVGADGAWSKVRSLVTDAKPRYTGRAYLESRVNRDSQFCETLAARAGAGMAMAIGDRKLVITQRQGNGSYRTYFGMEADEGFFGGWDLEDVEGTRRRVLDLFGDWADEYKDLVHYSTNFRTWPLYSLRAEDMRWKSVPGVTLIGDAAHLSVPNGDGVNLAMLDALQLAGKIAERGDENLDVAVQEYEKEMSPRGAETIKDGEAMATIMFGEGPQALVGVMKSFGG